MVIKEIADNMAWKQFLLGQPDTLFVQSPAYGSFYEHMGEEASIYGIYDNHALLGGALVLSTHAKRGNYLYIPYGPVLDVKRVEGMAAQKKVLRAFFSYLKAKAKKRGYDFIKVSPFFAETTEWKQFFSDVGFRPAPLHALAETTCLLDLTPSENVLLSGMKKNHRNLIRRCQREGVVVKMKTSDDALARFNTMHDEVVKRHKFRRFPKVYIEKEFHAFAREGEAVIFEAYLPDGRLDASSIIMFFGTMANYRHSASLNLNKKIPTSYLIQWSAIQEAKKRGCTTYNLWGIAPNDAQKHHPFYGITHFKKGFGGKQRDLLHCQDMPLSGRYWINWMVEILRKRKRKF